MPQWKLYCMINDFRVEVQMFAWPSHLFTLSINVSHNLLRKYILKYNEIEDNRYVDTQTSKEQ